MTLFPAASALAGAQHYGARLHEASWQASASRLSCTLAHSIPFYGTARFEQRAGGDLGFSMEVQRQPRQAGMAQLASIAPAWMHDAPALMLGEVPVATGAAPFRFDSAMARRLLAELEKGMVPTFTYQDWADGHDQVTVAVSALNLRTALGEFLGCLSGLLPFDFEAVRISPIQFAFGKSELSREARTRLTQVAEYLVADSSVSSVVIEGYTDNIGFRRYNEALSRRRIEAARNYLVARGVDAGKFVLRPKGEGKPPASNRTEQGRAQNRRAVVILVK